MSHTVSHYVSTSFTSSIRTNLLSTPSLCDITLISSDRTRHPASRLLLSLHCKFFRTLFSSAFHDSQAASIPLDIPAETLRDIIQYCAIGQSSILHTLQNHAQTAAIIAQTRHVTLTLSLPHPNPHPNPQPAADPDYSTAPYPCLLRHHLAPALSLAAAADYLHCPSLLSHAVSTLISLTAPFPYLACAVFEPFWGEYATWQAAPPRSLIRLFSEHPQTTFLTPPLSPDLAHGPLTLPRRVVLDLCGRHGIASLSFAALQALLDAQQVVYWNGVRVEHWFRALDIWCSTPILHDQSLLFSPDCTQDSAPGVTRIRREQTQVLMARLDYQQVSRKFFLHTVAENRFIAADTLANAALYHLQECHRRERRSETVVEQREEQLRCCNEMLDERVEEVELLSSKLLLCEQRAQKWKAKYAKKEVEIGQYEAVKIGRSRGQGRVL